MSPRTTAHGFAVVSVLALLPAASLALQTLRASRPRRVRRGLSIRGARSASSRTRRNCFLVAELAGGYVRNTDPRLQRWISLARDHGVGSVGFYGATPRDLAALLNRLQRAARVPLLNAANSEAGPGQQVPGATEFPANMAFEGDPHQSLDEHQPAEYRR